jgi:branched-chain amino acid transport system permease protein
MRAPRFLSPSVAVLISVAAATFAIAYGTYQLDVLVRVMLVAFVASGLRLLIGVAGQLSIGHAGFFAMGAYGSGIATTRWGTAPVLAIVLCAAGSAVIAWAIGSVVLRLKGLYLAMATLGFGTIVFVIVNTETAWTGGPDGMNVPPLTLFGLAVVTREAWFLLATAVLLAGIVLSENLQRSQFGHALQAMQASEPAASSCGIDITRAKVKIFAVSAAMASVGGSLLAHYGGYITPQVATFAHSVELLAIVIIGGSLSILGPVFGALVITTLPIALGSAPEGMESMVFGAVLVGVLILMPRGLESLARSLVDKARSR